MATAYVDITEIRSYLNLDVTTYDTELELIELESAKLIEEMLGYGILAEAGKVYTFDKFNHSLSIGRPLANAVVANDGTAIDTDYVDADEVNGIVYNLGGVITNRRKITLTCDVGYAKANIPKPIKLAIKMLMRLNWYESANGKDMFAKGQVDNGEGAAAYSIDRNSVYSEADKNIQPYKVFYL
jgi:hypothetical protein